MELLAALDVLRRHFVSTPSSESSDPWVDANNAEIPKRTIRNAVRAGDLVASKVGGKILVRRSALDEYISKRRIKPASQSPSALMLKLGAKRVVEVAKPLDEIGEIIAANERRRAKRKPRAKK